MDDANLDPDVFGPLASIPAASIVCLASRIASQVLHIRSSEGKLIARVGGSYNIVHIVRLETIKLVVRVPATGWGSGMTQTAARALDSQAATMRLIRSKTNVPIPEVYAMDTTGDNEIGAPYLCLSFMPGRPVSEVWFGNSGAVPREKFRLRILKSLAQTMAQFSCMTFDKIGSIMEDGSGSTSIGPAFDWDESDDGSIQVKASGPHESTPEYLRQHSVFNTESSIWSTAEERVTYSLMPCLQDLDYREGFVLCPPDFDSQNIMVDEQGTVTALIDWDPLMYGWPMMADTEDPPDALERYRACYNEELGEALGWIGDWVFTEKSHMVEAVWLAALHPHNRLEICRKFVHTALGDDVDALDVLYDIGVGDYCEEDWEVLKTKMRRLMCRFYEDSGSEEHLQRAAEAKQLVQSAADSKHDQALSS